MLQRHIKFKNTHTMWGPHRGWEGGGERERDRELRANKCFKFRQ